jgi:hypothetical protein
MVDGLTSASEPVLLYQEDFTSPLSGWKSDRFWSYNEGEYRGFLNERNSIIASPLPETSLFGRSNFCIAAQVRLFRAPGLTDNGFAGVYFGGITKAGNDFPTSSILVGIDSFGQLVAQETFYDERTNEVTPRFLLNAPGAIHDLTRFHTIQLSINNGQVEVLLDGAFMGALTVSPTSGEIGVMAFSFDEPNLNARFDNIAVVDVC